VTPSMPAVLIGLVFLLLPAAIPARALEAAAIMTGDPAGTSFRIGQDIADLARRFGVALEVVPSQGGLENIEALIARPNTQLAIVPSDVLDFIAGFPDDPELRPRARLMRVVFPLYAEEVHVLARPEIATFADLQGRRVAVGAPNSGTLLTATQLLATAGIEPAEELRIDGEEALTALREGRIDAVIYVAGQPAALFREGVAVEDALHLVPVDHPALRGYPASAIPAGTYYPWQPEEVPTVAPRAVLMTYHWTEPGYQEWACRLVGEIALIIADNLDRLRQDGHPKWREVDLDAEVPGWERSPCVSEQALAAALAGLESDVPGAPQALAAPGSGVLDPPARDCSAEDNPIRRRLCEVRPQLGAEP
jgi:uncharacterized protein